MRTDTAKMTMEEMLKGKYRGACHKGRQAWVVNLDICPKHHKGKSGNPNK